MNFTDLIKSDSWKSPENLFLKKVANPVFRMQQFYFFNFHGGGLKNLEYRVAGQQEDRKRICDEEWGYGLSIKYHKQLPNQYKVNSPP